MGNDQTSSGNVSSLQQTGGLQNNGTTNLIPAASGLQNNSNNTSINTNGAKGITLSSFDLTSNYDTKTYTANSSPSVPTLVGAGVVLVIFAVIVLVAARWQDRKTVPVEVPTKAKAKSKSKKKK